MGDFRDDQHYTFLVKSNLRSVAVENVIEFATEKQGLQSSIRLGIFVAQSTRGWESNDSLSGQLLDPKIRDLARMGDAQGVWGC